jgi:choline dehydrogenase-like flavoprotein
MPFHCRVNERFLDTIKGMGVPFREDTNDQKPASYITKLRTTVTADGKKSSASSFLSEKDIESRSNLNICLGAVVQRLDIDEDNRVQGVFVETEQSSGTTFYVKGKEVILCGGAVASPQLLLLRYPIQRLLISVVLVQKRNSPSITSSAKSISLVLESISYYPFSYF